MIVSLLKNFLIQYRHMNNRIIFKIGKINLLSLIYQFISFRKSITSLKNYDSNYLLNNLDNKQ